MEYIINPSWFYILQVVDVVRGVMIGLLIISGIFALVLGCIFIFTHDSQWYETNLKLARKCFKVACVVLGVAIIGVVLIPAKDTMIEMMVAKYATYQNAELAIEAIKEAVDYIINAIHTVG